MSAPLLLILCAIGTAWLITPGIRRLALRLGAVDFPGERKIHAVSVPRLGGVALALSFGMTIGVGIVLEALIGPIVSGLEPGLWFPLLAGGAIVLGVGVWDDVRPVPWWVKFFFQAGAACLAIGYGIRVDRVSLLGGAGLDLGVLALPITFLWIVGITNAFNLVDGLDGLAAGLAVIAAGAGATIFWLRGDAADALLLAILLGSLLGFLRFNFNPATIFLGDSGSLWIGYLLAVTAITGSQKGATVLAVVIPLLVFGLPIIDTLLSVVRRLVESLRQVHGVRLPLTQRLMRAKRIFEADQRHIHHRLLAIGYSHRKTVLLLYGCALALALLALLSVLAQYRNAGTILIAVGLATYIGIHKLGYQEVVFLRTGTLHRWYQQLPFSRLFFLGFADLFLCLAGYWLAGLLKFGWPWSDAISDWFLNTFPIVVATQFAVLWLSGVYRGVWQATSVGDVIRTVTALVPAVTLSYVVVLLTVPPSGTLSLFVIDALVVGMLLLGARSTHRFLEYVLQRQDHLGQPALIYGAGRGGQLLVRELLQNPALHLRPVGFIDDNPELWGKTIHQLPVLGSGATIGTLVQTYPVSAMIVSSRKIEPHALAGVLSVAQFEGIRVLRGAVHLESLLPEQVCGEVHEMPVGVTSEPQNGHSAVPAPSSPARVRRVPPSYSRP